MDKIKVLKKIGLTEHESVIYLALLELGPARIAKIAEKTAIHRPLIYKAIPDLLAKKLVTKNQRQKGFVRYACWCALYRKIF